MLDTFTDTYVLIMSLGTHAALIQDACEVRLLGAGSVRWSHARLFLFLPFVVSFAAVSS